MHRSYRYTTITLQNDFGYRQAKSIYSCISLLSVAKFGTKTLYIKSFWWQKELFFDKNTIRMEIHN